jgi:hypothetical protein
VFVFHNIAPLQSTTNTTANRQRRAATTTNNKAKTPATIKSVSSPSTNEAPLNRDKDGTGDLSDCAAPPAPFCKA